MKNKKNKEEKRLYDRARRLNIVNLERERARRLKTNFGLSISDYETLLKTQEYVCAICKQPEVVIERGKLRRLSVDHDHYTKKVRGLLCYSCNLILGKSKDSSQQLRAAANYLEQKAGQ